MVGVAGPPPAKSVDEAQLKSAGQPVDQVPISDGADGVAWGAVPAGAPSAHAASHENGGADEVSVVGLSGLLADPQTPTTHTHVEADITDLGTYIPASEKAAANGVATLDGATKIPIAQLPDSIVGQLEYKGTWDAATNTPALADGTGSLGWFYIVNVAGTQNLGSGPLIFAVGDWALHNGTIYEKVLNSHAVASVFGRTGTVVAAAGDYTATEVTNVPAGNIAGITVQAAIDELDTEKEPAIGAKGTAFNKNFGSAATTVTEGDDIRLSDARTPLAHNLGGAEHTADTLANLNLKVSDATLDDSAASRPPNGAAAGDLTGTYPNPSVVQASTTTPGKIEIATQTEVNTATDSTRAITPNKLPKNNFAASTNPSATDDSAANYKVGSIWINTTDDIVWRCVDSTATAAIWLPISHPTIIRPLRAERDFKNLTYTQADSVKWDDAAYDPYDSRTVEFILNLNGSTDNVSIRAYNITDLTVLGSLTAIATGGVKSFTFTKPVSADALVEIQIKKDTNASTDPTMNAANIILKRSMA